MYIFCCSWQRLLDFCCCLQSLNFSLPIFMFCCFCFCFVFLFRSVGLFSGNQPKVVERAEPRKAQKGGAGTGTGSGLELDIYATPSTTWTKTRRAEEEEQQQRQQQATCDSTRQDEAAVKY